MGKIDAVLLLYEALDFREISPRWTDAVFGSWTWIVSGGFIREK